MRNALGWQEGIYARISAELRQAGLINAGRGRGGSVSLAEIGTAKLAVKKLVSQTGYDVKDWSSKRL